jgi:hypothetical protein
MALAHADVTKFIKLHICLEIYFLATTEEQCGHHNKNNKAVTGTEPPQPVYYKTQKVKLPHNLFLHIFSYYSNDQPSLHTPSGATIPDDSSPRR